MTRLRCGSLTIGETTETESIAAIAGRAPAATCIAQRDLAPPSTAHRSLDAVKIENADELAFFYGEE
jgi:hypothetical protein